MCGGVSYSQCRISSQRAVPNLRAARALYTRHTRPTYTSSVCYGACDETTRCIVRGTTRGVWRMAEIARARRGASGMRHVRSVCARRTCLRLWPPTPLRQWRPQTRRSAAVRTPRPRGRAPLVLEVPVRAKLRWNHLSNTTCLTQFLQQWRRM